MKLRFRSPAEALGFAAVLVAVAGVYGIYFMLQEAKRTQEAADWRRLTAARATVEQRSDAAKLRCRAEVTAVIQRAFPNGLASAAALPPTSTTALRGVQFTSEGRTAEPNGGAFFGGKQRCEPVQPARVREAFGPQVPRPQAASFAAELEAFVPTVDQFKTPAVVGAAWCGKPPKEKRAVAVFAWISAADARPLAVLRIPQPEYALSDWCAFDAQIAAFRALVGWH